MKQPKVALRADTFLFWALFIPNKCTESPAKRREPTWNFVAGTSIEAAGGDAVAEVPVAELDRGRRKGRRPTRAEKGSYMGNQDFVREVRIGCSMACPHLDPSASCLLCSCLIALAARVDMFKVSGRSAHVTNKSSASSIALNASILLRIAGLSNGFIVDDDITPAAGGLVPHSAISSIFRDNLQALMPLTVHIGHSG